MLKQKQEEGKAWLSALKFESNNITPIRTKEDLKTAADLTDKEYFTGGGTNLIDAVGHALTDINQALKEMDKADRPTPIVVIITDGEENQSRNWTSAELKKQMEDCQERGWQAVYLGANADAWSTANTAASLGLSSTRAYNYSTDNMSAAYESIGCATSTVRAFAASNSIASTTEDLFAGSRSKEVK